MKCKHFFQPSKNQIEKLHTHSSELMRKQKPTFSHIASLTDSSLADHPPPWSKELFAFHSLRSALAKLDTCLAISEPCGSLSKVSIA